MQQKWVQKGNELDVNGTSVPSVVALTASRVAYYFNAGFGNNDELRTYDFDGTDWAQVGNALTLGRGITGFLAKLTSVRVALWVVNELGSNRTLRTFDFDGTNWAQVGNTFTTTDQFGEIAGLTTSRIALADDQGNTLRTYDFDGTDWAQVGNALSVNFPVNAPIAALSSSRVVSAFRLSFIDHIQAYDFDGTDWTTVGNALAQQELSGIDSYAVLDATTVVGTDDNNVATYVFDGTDWSRSNEIEVIRDNSTLSSSMTALSATEIVRTGSNADILFAYELKESGQHLMAF